MECGFESGMHARMGCSSKCLPKLFLKVSGEDSEDALFQVRRDNGFLPRVGLAEALGPTLVELPSSMRGDRGRFHCFFGHHHGRHIRLAHADDLAGPWTVHRPLLNP